jgi:hypothetical protein
MTTVLDSDLANGDTSAGSFTPSQFVLGGPLLTQPVVVLTGENLPKYAAIGLNTAGKAVAWDPTALARTGDRFATGVLTFGGQPTADDTLTINGHAITFKASGATGAQVNIGGTATLTATAVLTYLNANTSTVAVTARQNGTRLTLEANTAGAVGNAVTLAKSGDYPTLSAATLTGGADDTSVPAAESTLAGFLAQAVNATSADVSGPAFMGGTFNYNLIDWGDHEPASIYAAQSACVGTKLTVSVPGELASV